MSKSSNSNIFEFRGDFCPNCGEKILTDIVSHRKLCNYDWGCGYDSDLEAEQLKLF